MRTFTFPTSTDQHAHLCICDDLGQRQRQHSLELSQGTACFQLPTTNPRVTSLACAPVVPDALWSRCLMRVACASVAVAHTV